MNIQGNKVVLKPLTRELCHEIYQKYIADPMMCDGEYEYSIEKVDEYYDKRSGDSCRTMFAIFAGGEAIGEVQIKYINYVIKKGNLGIHLVNDCVKGKGYGTEAEKLIINYAFEALGLNTLYADAVIRNTRSQYVLEKLGFRQVYEDDYFKYYELNKDHWKHTTTEESI